MSELLDKMKRESKCDVCGAQGIVGVGASQFGPASFAYCRDCLDCGAEVWGVITWAFFQSGGESQPDKNPLGKYVKKTLEATMTRLGKTPEDLEARMKELQHEERTERLNQYISDIVREKYSLAEVVREFARQKATLDRMEKEWSGTPEPEPEPPSYTESDVKMELEGVPTMEISSRNVDPSAFSPIGFVDGKGDLHPEKAFYKYHGEWHKVLQITEMGSVIINFWAAENL